jgi:hypothetical protein
LEPEELLRRARSRLLEDLSEGGAHGNGSGGSNGDGRGGGGGVLILPHSLTKYKEVSRWFGGGGEGSLFSFTEYVTHIHHNAPRS